MEKENKIEMPTINEPVLLEESQMNWGEFASEVKKTVLGKQHHITWTKVLYYVWNIGLVGSLFMLVILFYRQKVELNNLISQEQRSREKQVSDAKMEIENARKEAFDTVSRLSSSVVLVRLGFDKRFQSMREEYKNEISAKVDKEKFANRMTAIDTLLHKKAETIKLDTELALLHQKLNSKADDLLYKLKDSLYILRNTLYSSLKSLEKEVDDKLLTKVSTDSISRIREQMARLSNSKADRTLLNSYVTLSVFKSKIDSFKNILAVFPDTSAGKTPLQKKK